MVKFFRRIAPKTKNYYFDLKRNRTKLKVKFDNEFLKLQMNQITVYKIVKHFQISGQYRLDSRLVFIWDAGTWKSL